MAGQAKQEFVERAAVRARIVVGIAALLKHFGGERCRERRENAVFERCGLRLGAREPAGNEKNAARGLRGFAREGTESCHNKAPRERFSWVPKKCVLSPQALAVQGFCACALALSFGRLHSPGRCVAVRRIGKPPLRQRMTHFKTQSARESRARLTCGHVVLRRNSFGGRRTIAGPSVHAAAALNARSRGSPRRCTSGNSPYGGSRSRSRTSPVWACSPRAAAPDAFSWQFVHSGTTFAP